MVMMPWFLRQEGEILLVVRICNIDLEQWTVSTVNNEMLQKHMPYIVINKFANYHFSVICCKVRKAQSRNTSTQGTMVEMGKLNLL
jgi:hypothetical protein